MDLCLWNYDVKHDLVVVVGFYLNNLMEGRKEKKFQVWNVAVVHPGTVKNEEEKSMVENPREVAKEVKYPANKLENIFFSSLESALRHMWNNCGIIALYTIYLY